MMDPRFKQIQNQFSSTEVISKEYSYTWTVKNPRHLEINTKLDSPIFTWGNENQCKWKFGLYFGQCCTNHDLLCLKLFPIQTNLTYKTISIMISFTAVDKEFILVNKTVQTVFLTINNPLICHNFIKNDQIELKIRCKIFFEGIPIHRSITKNPVDQFSSSNYKSTTDFETIFETGKLSDFTIVIGDENFPVHKAILAARSTVFAAMFEHNVREKTENTVQMTDIKPNVMKELLRFIYAGKVKDIRNMECDLLAAANNYALIKLKEICEQKMIFNIDHGNAIEYLVLAHEHQAKHLKECATNFVINNAETILQTEKFKSDMKLFSHDFGEICLELLSKVQF